MMIRLSDDRVVLRFSEKRSVTLLYTCQIANEGNLIIVSEEEQGWIWQFHFSTHSMIFDRQFTHKNP